MRVSTRILVRNDCTRKQLPLEMRVVSLLREERGQKERDERTCVHVKSQVGT